MARQKNSFGDKDWLEVEEINSYAIFMGYLLMGVRGLGLLVLTWTTVVLLGGFVSMLRKKDFWCLTAITLVQTAGVFDFLLKEKASDVGNSLKGLLFAVVAVVMKPLKEDTNTAAKPWITREVVGIVLLVVQVVVLGLVLCPLAVLYVLGLYLSAAISLWRLIQHDYGNPDGGANLKPALNVLYSLAVAQGVVYSYRAIYDVAARTELVERVRVVYSLKTDLVSEYLDETVAGCMKDPSFARGRNLVTYAVELLMESKSRYDYVSGIRILSAVTLWSPKRSGFLKQLLTGSASFSHVVQRLVETFGPTSPYSTKIRVGAARIVATVAGSIRLDMMMIDIECISSLLDTFEEYSWRPEEGVYERGWLLDEEEGVYAIPRATEESDRLQSYEVLVVEGLRILQKLAANKNNCRVISNTEGLLSKTMAHLTSDKLHEDHHDEWYSIAKESLEFMNQFMATLGGGTETTKLTSEISSSSQTAIMRTLGCHKCPMLLTRKAAQVLLHCPLPDRRKHGATHLLKQSSYTTRLAGEKMQAMMHSKTEASGTSMLPSVVGDVIGSLARTVAGAENKAYRIHAAMILEDLCRSYTKDDENLKELKKAMSSVMPEVLKEIVHWLTTEEIQVVTEANNGGKVLLIEGPDLEQGGVPHGNDNGEESSSTPYYQQKGEQHQGIVELQEALLNLCWMISFRWIDKDQDLTHQFNDIAAEICSGQGMPHKNFRELVEEAQDKLREKRASRLEAGRTS